MKLKCALVGSRFFGASVLEALRNEKDVELMTVVAPAADDRLALAAGAAGVALHVLDNPKLVPQDAIGEGADLIIAAHTHARVSPEALARSRLGGVGYHPSLLPRHRGIAAVEWTILEGDPIAGGSIYHLADGWDAGPIAAQDWCFVLKGETARELWERALAPIGLALLTRVVRFAQMNGHVPAHPQDPRFATRAPMIRKAVVSTENVSSSTRSLVVTIVGADRHGIVSLLAECAERHGANWMASRMARLAGDFAGMVHFDVPQHNADALARSLRALASSGLQVIVSESGGAEVRSGLRVVELELVSDDRLGIVSRVTKILAERGVSVESIHTEIIHSGVSGNQMFKLGARLLVPEAIHVDELRRELGELAGRMTIDIALGERYAGAA